MTRWPSVKAKQLLAALQSIGWEVKRVTGSHRSGPRKLNSALSGKLW